MKSVVVFESMYGNTHEIAEQIAAGLESIGPVVLGNPAQVPATTAADADLLVVGGLDPQAPSPPQREPDADTDQRRGPHVSPGI